MELLSFGKWVIFFGLGIVFVGFLLWLGGKFGIPFGKLPGDISVKGDKFSLYVPIVTSIVFSILLTIIINILIRLFNKS